MYAKAPWDTCLPGLTLSYDCDLHTVPSISQSDLSPSASRTYTCRIHEEIVPRSQRGLYSLEQDRAKSDGSPSALCDMANVQILEQLLLLQEQVKFFTIPRTFLLSVAILVLFQVILLAYNVYAHPLAKIPGPKLAAMSKLYELWHDLGRKGRYVFEIERMHAKYG